MTLWLLAAALVTAGVAGEIPPELQSLVADRARIATALAAPIAHCVQRRDTGHPAFHGCIDWHSAVHGTWALLALERATGDRRHASLVDEILEPQALGKERSRLAARPRFEMPYGRSWFLRLAIEHGRARQSPALIPMADDIAAGLMRWLLAAGADPSSRDYASQGWALVNLLDYAAHRRDFGLAAKALSFTRDGFVPIDRECDLESERGGFMATCMVRVMLVSRVLKPAQLASWIDRFLPDIERLVPVTDPRSAHEYGMNFSRAWGLWEVFAATGRMSFANSYAAHVATGFGDRKNWAGDYRSVGHWVAQFGMFAVQPLFGGVNYR